MRSLSLTALCGLVLILYSSVERTVGQEKEPKGSVGDDLNVFWGDKGTVWEFEKKDAMKRTVRLHFRMPRGGKPMFGHIAYGEEVARVERFEYAVSENAGKRYMIISISKGKTVVREMELNYQLEGDTLRILAVRVLEGEASLDMKGNWKRMPLKK